MPAPSPYRPANQTSQPTIVQGPGTDPNTPTGTTSPTPSETPPVASALRGIVVTVTVDTPIVSGRLVALVDGDLVYYQPGLFNHRHALQGVSLTGAQAGGTITVQTRGAAYLPGWNLIPDTEYRAGDDGIVVANAPAGRAFVRIVGRAVDSDTLLFNPSVPVVLN